MNIKLEFDIGDIVNWLIFISAVVGLFLNYLQMKKNTDNQRAALLRSLLEPFTSDSEISSIYYLIEYGRFEYSDNFHLQETEKCTDKLLSHCDMICTFYHRGLLADSEVEYFSYFFNRIWLNDQIQEYLTFLDRVKIGDNERNHFNNFRRYCHRKF